MKTKDFWNLVCKEFDFRFFVGVPFDEFKLLFNSMDAEILHYIPAITDSIAVGVASGVYISGIKSAVLINGHSLEKLKHEIHAFNVKYKVPILFITEKTNRDLGLKEFTLNELTELTTYMYEEEHLPCVLVLNYEELI